MARYQIKTLVDITRTNVTRSDTDEVRIGQQHNFNSLVQAIGLRANVQWDTDPSMHSGTLPKPFNGKANHWVWQFEVEQPDIFLKGNDPVGLLVDDINGVPVVPNLKNTADIHPAVFQTKGENINTYISIIL